MTLKYSPTKHIRRKMGMYTALPAQFSHITTPPPIPPCPLHPSYTTTTTSSPLLPPPLPCTRPSAILGPLNLDQIPNQRHDQLYGMSVLLSRLFARIQRLLDQRDITGHECW